MPSTRVEVNRGFRRGRDVSVPSLILAVVVAVAVDDGGDGGGGGRAMSVSRLSVVGV